MEIRLYHNVIKRIDSTYRPQSDIFEIRQVRLKEETSIMNPVFTLSDYDPQYNYLYVPSWGRYYFISDVKLNITGVWELSCKFDVLASYKNSIGALTTFVERTSDGRYISPFIRDNAVSSESKIVSTESASTDAFPSATCYILRVLGRGSTNGIGTFCITQSDVQTIFSGVWGDIDDGTLTDYIYALANLYINDPAQYIIGVYRSPIGMTTYLNHGQDEQTVYVGGHKTSLKAIRVDNPQAVLFSGKVLNKPANMYNDFRATDPAFSQYSMYIPTIGFVSLPAEIMHMTLTMTCCADLFTGDLTFMLYADGDLITSYTSNCYASVSVGVQNGSSGASLLANATGIAGGLATGNVALATSNIIQGTKSVISPPASVLGTQGSIGAIETYPDIVITCSQKSSSDFPTGVYGRPCEKNLLLGNLSGYIKCQKASINNIAGFDEDKKLINDYLNNGFYME